MYPNPQDVLPLPPRPSLEHFRKSAKRLAKACQSGNDAIDAWATRWVGSLLRPNTDAYDHGQRDAERFAHQIAHFARMRMTTTRCALTQAQFVVARAHGFTSWSKLVHHIKELPGFDSSLSAFERAADAIIGGDLPGLERLLAGRSDLVYQRSSREHRATLLHYVSANGVENYRQRTPANIVAVTRLLLDAGAEVDAEADVYGGGATTLGLVVTSAHPRQAGVQNALADLLLERGASLDPGIVWSCLMNGCPEAAMHMAARSASLSLEEAAGIGRLDLVARYFESSRMVSPTDAVTALMMASWYDQRDVVTLLLDHGIDAGARNPKDGDTALHIAAYRGNPALVELLLKRGAPVNVTDGVYGTPPLVWALHAWLGERRSDAEGYRRVLRMLAEAGAEVKLEWLADSRLRAERELYAVLARCVATS